MAMTLVSTVTVGAGGAFQIEFTNIPQTGKDLLVLASVRDSSSQNDGFLALRINADSGNNYANRRLDGNGATTSSTTGRTDLIQVLGNNRTDSTANTFSNVSFYLSNYSGSTSKSVSVDAVTENNGTTAYQSLNAGIYTPTTAVTSCTVVWNGFVQHSSASLYIIS